MKFCQEQGVKTKEIPLKALFEIQVTVYSGFKVKRNNWNEVFLKTTFLRNLLSKFPLDKFLQAPLFTYWRISKRVC